MRLIHQFVGFVTGLIMGLLLLITTIAVGSAYFITNDEKKEKEKPKAEPDVTLKVNTDEKMDENTYIAIHWSYIGKASADFNLTILKSHITNKGRATIGDLKRTLNIGYMDQDDLEGWDNLDSANIMQGRDNKYYIFYPAIRKFAS